MTVTFAHVFIFARLALLALLCVFRELGCVLLPLNFLVLIPAILCRYTTVLVMPRRHSSPSPSLERGRVSRASGGASSRTSTITSASAAAAHMSAPAVDLSSVSSQPDESDGASLSSLRSLSRGVPRIQVSVSDFDAVFQGEASHSVGHVSSVGQSALLSFSPSAVVSATTVLCRRLCRRLRLPL